MMTSRLSSLLAMAMMGSHSSTLFHTGISLPMRLVNVLTTTGQIVMEIINHINVLNDVCKTSKIPDHQLQQP